MDGYVYIRAPSAVIETALICKLKAFVIHHRVGLGLNSRHINANPCPSPLGHARPASSLKKFLLNYIDNKTSQFKENFNDSISNSCPSFL